MTTPEAGESDERKVFIALQAATCTGCRTLLPPSSWITVQEKDAFCMKCSKLDTLEFLPSGNAALTRRSTKYSGLYAVVLKWSRARKRYERQGTLVEAAARERAEQDCATDADKRAVRNERAGARRAIEDAEFIIQFTRRVREVYPYCPEGVDALVAQHACTKHSGRVGRSAAAKELDEDAVRLAVRAHIRHTHTNYDQLMLQRVGKREARDRIRPTVDAMAHRWEMGP